MNNVLQWIKQKSKEQSVRQWGDGKSQLNTLSILDQQVDSYAGQLQEMAATTNHSTSDADMKHVLGRCSGARRSRNKSVPNKEKTRTGE